MPSEQDRVLKLLALVALKSVPQPDQIWLMSQAGYQPIEIAETLSLPRQSVRNRLSEMRKERKK